MSALVCNRGDTLRATFTLAAQDTSGWTPRFVVKARSGWEGAPDTAAVLTATVGAGLTHVPGATSTVTLLIAASVMALIEPGVYVWDLQFTSGTSVLTTSCDGATTGTLTIVADVTRTTP